MQRRYWSRAARLEPRSLLLSPSLPFPSHPRFTHKTQVGKTKHSLATNQPASDFDTEVDVLIVGSGAAGLTAALRAHSLGLRPLIVEKHSQVGGSSAYSGGGLWIPNSPLARAAGISDSTTAALEYMERVAGGADAGPASSGARRRVFLDRGPPMVSFLQGMGFKWRLSRGCPDYYPQAPGAMRGAGRSIEPDVFDAKRLGPWRALLRSRPRQPPPLFTDEVSSVTRMGSSLRDFAALVRVMLRGAVLSWRGQAPVTMGQSLVGQLLALNREAGTSLWCGAGLAELVLAADGSAVAGARVMQDGREKRIRARRGVLLTTGGFARNREMREQWSSGPVSVDWTSAPEGDMGDGIRAGRAVGAATALLDEAWWGPSLLDPQAGKYYFALQERARPFSIIVDSSGSRFMNEAAPYVDAAKSQYARHKSGTPAIPAWFIFDWNHRKRYAVGSLLPRQEPTAGIKAGYVFRADTLDGLAQQIGVDAAGLRGTVARFNVMAREGVDQEFGRGGNAFDNYFGDPRVGPNPNLGLLGKAPFYALPVVPGDLGTKGGLLTDENARVLREDGTLIQGLYAAGNTSASVMGRTYPGAGSTLGPAMTFAFIAVDHMNEH